MSAPTGPLGSDLERIVSLARNHVLEEYGEIGRPVCFELFFNAKLLFTGYQVALMSKSLTVTEDDAPCRALLDVVALLGRVNHRLTLSQIMSELDRQGTPHGESTVRRALAKAVADELLTNDQEANPKGYGLKVPGWGK